MKKLSILLSLPALLLGQATPNRPVPDDVLFHFFFLRVSSSAAEAIARGSSESVAKRTLKAKAGLTDAEVSLVNAAALSCNDAYESKTRSGSEEVRQLAAQNLQNSTPSAAVAARINALERERAQVVTDCLDSLKRSMGTARFTKMETYVRQTSSVRYVDPTKPDPSLRNIPPPAIKPASPGDDPQQGGVK